MELLALDASALVAAILVTGARFPAAVVYIATALVLVGRPQRRITERITDDVARIVAGVSVPLVLPLGFVPFSRAWLLALSSATAIVSFRSLAAAARRLAHRRGRFLQPTLIVGTGETALLVAQLMVAHPELGLRPLGFCDSCPPLDALPLPLLGVPNEIERIAEGVGVAKVILAFGVDRDQDLIPTIRRCRRLPIDLYLVPRLSEIGPAMPARALDEIWGIPLVAVRATLETSRSQGIKRTVDVIVATLALLVLGPLCGLLAALVYLTSGRPVLFRQRRVTGVDEEATILKFRTLPAHHDSDTRWDVPTVGVTRLGAFLRSSHLDELPQLVNVVRGEMSLVGPRPERPYFVARLSATVRDYDARNRARAGITGWAQVHGLHGDTSIEDRVRFDNQYIERWSLWLDLVILARTVARAIPAIIGGRR
jgi:exopolysaccharide biosynthesis polyprenyl glycosylphosphotransferase